MTQDNQETETTQTAKALPSSSGSPRIIQILVAPNDATWQGMLLGLGDDGITYMVGSKNMWEPMIRPIADK